MTPYKQRNAGQVEPEEFAPRPDDDSNQQVNLAAEHFRKSLPEVEAVREHIAAAQGKHRAEPDKKVADLMAGEKNQGHPLDTSMFPSPERDNPVRQVPRPSTREAVEKLVELERQRQAPQPDQVFQARRPGPTY